MKDSEWIADLVRHGLIQGSYIPSRKQRELREMVRNRQLYMEERARELNRVQAVLEGVNIKLSSVVSDTNRQTALSILQAMAKGETDGYRKWR